MYIYPVKLKMGRNLQAVRGIGTCLIIFQLLLPVTNLKAEDNINAIKTNFNRNYMAVTFNPTISVLDIGYEKQYNVHDLIKFIRKIHTEFDQIAVEYDPSIDVQQSSRYLFPRAVAEYNKIYSSNVKLWIIEKSCNSENLQSYTLRLKQIKKLVEDADLICSGSMKSILLDHSCRHFIDDSATTVERLEIANKVFAKHQIMCNNSMITAQIGIIIPSLQSNRLVESSRLFHKIKPLTDFIFLHSTRQKDKIGAIDERDDPLADYESLINNSLGNLQSESGRNLHIGLMTGVQDTSPNGVVNFTDMVAFWDTISNWAEWSKVPVIMKSAFDRPNHGVYLKECSMGWFRLVENSLYKTPFEYIFNSKRELMLKATKNSTDINDGKRANFSRSFFATFVQPGLVAGKEILDLGENETELIPLMRLVSSRFGTIVIGMRNGDPLLQKIIRATALWNKNYANDKVKMMRLFVSAFLSLKQNLNEFDLAVKMANEAEAIYPNTVAGIIIYTRTDDFIPEVQQVLGSNNFTVPYKIAVAISIKKCPHEKTREFLRNVTASLPTIQMLFFTAFEYYLTTGVQRTCTELTTLMETCERLVLEIEPKQNLEMGFMTRWPGVNLEGRPIFSQLVDFWETLNVWASERNRTVMLWQAFDSDSSAQGGPPQDGWWKLVPKSEYRLPSDLVFQEKRTGALVALVEKAKEELHHDESMRIERVAAVTSVMAVMVVAIICTSLYFCYYFRTSGSQNLTKQELHEFLKGTKKSTVNIASYDADKFEVKSGEFETDKE